MRVTLCLDDINGGWGRGIISRMLLCAVEAETTSWTGRPSLQAGTGIICISLPFCWPALSVLKEDFRPQPRVTGLVFAVFPLTWKAEFLLCSFKPVSKLREIKHSPSGAASLNASGYVFPVFS